MSDGLPRGADRLQVCEWCGASIVQPPTGRRRRYCGRTHRELAYRERKTVRRVADAVEGALAAAAPETSVDETGARSAENPNDARADAERPRRRMRSRGSSRA